MVEVEPGLGGLHLHVRRWARRRGGGEPTGPLSSIEHRKTVSSIKDDGLGTSEKGDLIIVKASIGLIKSEDAGKLWYPACPAQVDSNRTCNKKMAYDALSSMWSCSNGCSAPAPVYRYIMAHTIADATSSEYITSFDEVATQILGISAGDLHRASEAHGGDMSSAPIASHFTNALFKEYLFSIKCKMENTNRDENRMRATAVKVRPIDFVKESKILLAYIKKY